MVRNMVSEERIKTNLLLTDYLDYWDELSVKSIDDEWSRRYYVYLMNQINQQINEAIGWLDTEEAKDFFFGHAQEQKEIFEELESEWERILNEKYETIDDLLEEVYKYGKIKGYQKISETLKYTETDKLALTHVRNYNFNLIQKLDGELRQAIKNRIFQAVISGENPRSFANKLVDLGLERLPNSTFTPQQRAVMIARTEVARAQNTGILQSYVNEGYTQVKILTAEDDNVCYLCLKNAYEFNEDDDVIFANRGEERIHNIKDLIDKKNWVPLHPNCRCTYLSIWESKSESKGEVVNLTNDNYSDWAYEYDGTEYRFHGNTPLSREKFQMKYGIDINKLSEDEKLFLMIYTKNSGPINDYLRLEEKTDECFNYYSKKWGILSSGLKKEKELEINLSFEDALNIYEGIFKKYSKKLDEDIILCRRENNRHMGRDGKKVYDDKAFTSTSIYEFAKEDEYGNNINYILVPKGERILYIEGITSAPEDYEVLFKPGIHLDWIEDLGSNKKVWKLG
ncbi:phage minor head protein [Methanobrevibacter ruminantium]|uniref:phage minor head protein n=2 Tax=Methanobrevibacter ruminantium TaxID=83816 RepID=UPI0026EE7B93|nr:phage minor head protein [Methanobrevibacter ruminantium]